MGDEHQSRSGFLRYGKRENGHRVLSQCTQEGALGSFSSLLTAAWVMALHTITKIGSSARKHMFDIWSSLTSCWYLGYVHGYLATRDCNLMSMAACMRALSEGDETSFLRKRKTVGCLTRWKSRITAYSVSFQSTMELLLRGRDSCQHTVLPCTAYQFSLSPTKIRLKLSKPKDHQLWLEFLGF